MVKHLFTALIFVGLLTAVSAISISAQTNLTGKYVNREVIADEELYNQGLDKQETILELKSSSAATLTDVSKGEKSPPRQGTWTWNKAKKSLSVKFPVNKKEEVGFTYVFSVNGSNLKLVKMLTDEGEGEGVGRIFKKL